MKDTLIKFSSEYPYGLEYGLESKYGDPQKKNEEKNITCVSKRTNIPYSFKEFVNQQLWYNGSIYAEILQWTHYDSNCKKFVVSSFSVEDSAKEKSRRDCESMSDDNGKEKLRQEMFKKVDGL
jgi:hypothetical protein